MLLPSPLASGARALVLLFVLVALLAVFLGREPAPGADRSLVDHLDRGLSVDRIVGHMRALEGIAFANGGHRATGTAGYDASVDYVASRLREYGYEPEHAELEYDHFTTRDLAEAIVEAPGGERWHEPAHLRTLVRSGSGDVAGPVVHGEKGCSRESFPTIPTGAIALVERGGCTFAEKARVADAAGAAALLVVPGDEDAEERAGTDPMRGFLRAPAPLPVLGATRAVGEALAERLATGPVRVQIRADTAIERRRTASVLAETPAGDPREVIVLGAHLDSVTGSPGIDDNASSVGLLLELARLLAERRDLAHRVRFAFWTGEEKRLLGSRSYLDGLDEEERARIALYLNFDMIASPNFTRIVYDGDGTAGGAPWPQGSAAIEDAFREHFEARGLAVEERDVTGRSDHGPFVRAGIPSGGVGSFARGEKTHAQAEVFGGEPRSAVQPCYHRACDTLARTNLVVLEEIARATASVVGRFAGVAVPVSYVERRNVPLISRSRTAMSGVGRYGS